MPNALGEGMTGSRITGLADTSRINLEKRTPTTTHRDLSSTTGKSAPTWTDVKTVRPSCAAGAPS
ncbi:hypothetical protein [Rhodococcus sp. ARC_M6]|uniref:hypothetical protein n=1 Tax=Rhodococcus sp. ARC_M6 TaxID=2928852 RepID=UPI001FB20592|nr:hypothetical protein [Rhodococcus sp. ARC_M6]MCJ0907019.1 hypothetical protein [Rhodococcus sp. ARC_M6]